MKRFKPSHEARNARKGILGGSVTGDHYLYSYGIPTQDVRAMLEEQAGRCAVCSVEIILSVKGTRGSARLDHDHETQEIRGLLCNRCNSYMGAIDSDLLPRLLEYKEKYSG